VVVRGPDEVPWFGRDSMFEPLRSEDPVRLEGAARQTSPSPPLRPDLRTPRSVSPANGPLRRMQKRGRMSVGRGPCPVVAVLVPAKEKKPDESIPAPKGRKSWPPKRLTPCKSGIFRVPQWGAMTSVMAPPTTPFALPRFGPEGRLTGGRGPCPRCGGTSRVCKKTQTAC
jgi:hypothetical protein